VPSQWDYPFVAAAAAACRLSDLQAACLRLYVTPKEAAMLTGLAESLIRRWVREGKIPGWKTGAGWRIKREILQSAIEHAMSLG
jgi:excisionase family DNA binding protein